MDRIRAGRIGTCTRGDRLDALALTISEDAQRVGCKRRSPLVAAENLPDAIEVGFQPLLAGRDFKRCHVSVGSRH